MPVNEWTYQVDLTPVFHNEDMTFEERRDEIVRRVRRNIWFRKYEMEDGISELEVAVEELATSEDAEEFAWAWDVVYDIADDDRCWIKTF